MTIYTSFSIEYAFTELEVSCPGLLADGVATLVHDCDGEFYVENFRLTGGALYQRNGSGALGGQFSKTLFSLISVEIENDRAAQDFFARKLADYCEPASLIAAE